MARERGQSESIIVKSTMFRCDCDQLSRRARAGISIGNGCGSSEPEAGYRGDACHGWSALRLAPPVVRRRLATTFSPAVRRNRRLPVRGGRLYRLEERAFAGGASLARIARDDEIAVQLGTTARQLRGEFGEVDAAAIRVRGFAGLGHRRLRIHRRFHAGCAVQDIPGRHRGEIAEAPVPDRAFLGPCPKHIGPCGRQSRGCGFDPA